MKWLSAFVLCLFVMLNLTGWTAVRIDGNLTDYVTITNALAHAVPDDVIRATTGTYNEVFNIYNKSVMIDGNYDAACVSKVAGSTELRLSYVGAPVVRISNSVVRLIDLDIAHGLSPMGFEINGGGIRISGNSDVHLDHCQIHNNSINGYGGGIYVSNSTLAVTNTTVVSNRASKVSGGKPGRGGGYAVLNASLEITGGTDCNVEYNHASDAGGGIYIEHGTCVVSSGNADILYNTATNGGGIAAIDSSSLEVFAGADVCGNRAFHAGGGIWLSGASTGTIRDALTYIGYNASTLGPNVVSNTTSETCYGGGIAAEDSRLIIENSARVAHNNSKHFGGGIYLSNSVCTIDGGSVGYPANFSNTNEAMAGGGVYLVAGSQLVLSNGTIIHGNVARFSSGGGIFCHHSTISMDQSTVRYNRAAGSSDGGGLALDNSSITGRQSTIHNNQCLGSGTYGEGGGLYAFHSPTLFDGVTMSNNFAARNGGAVCWKGIAADQLFLTNSCSIRNNSAGLNGGGLWLNGRINISETTVNLNTATNHGGGLFLSNALVTISDIDVQYNEADCDQDNNGDGGGIWLGYRSHLQLRSSTDWTLISHNEAYSGAGLYIGPDGTATVTKTDYGLLINDNEAARHGGGMAVSEGSLVVTGAVSFYQNSALTFGGGIYAYQAKVYLAGGVVIGHSDTNYCNWAKYGGGLSSDSSSIALDNVSFINNVASNDAGGIDLANGDIGATNVLLRGNQALLANGGGIYATLAEGSFLNVTFSSNSAAGGYGGAMCWGNDRLEMTACSAINNNAQHGGGFYLHSTAVFFNAVTVSLNQASSTGGGIAAQQFCVLNATNLVLHGNAATGNGGGIMIKGQSQVSLYGTNGMTVINSNSAAYGGGVAITNAHLVIEKNGWIEGNYVTRSGSGLWIAQTATAEVNGVYFLRNTATMHGGGVYINTNALIVLHNSLLAENEINMAAFGGGLRNNSGKAILTACTIISNESSGVECSPGSTLEMQECISYGHRLLNVSAGYDVTYSCIDGGYPGTGNFDEEPLLYNGNYHLTDWSPCRNRGQISGGRDVDNEARSGNVDVGFDEYVDSDNDHLPDIVETDTGITTSDIDMGTDPAVNDTDSDGIFDGDEWLADTDPNNPSSILRVTNVTVTAGDFFEIRWSGGSNAWQYLEVARDFSLTSSPNWQLRNTYSPPTSPSGYNSSLCNSSTTVFRIRATRFP